MNVKTTKFDYNYHYSQWFGNCEYLFHNVDIYNVIQFKGLELSAVYQAGQSFLQGDFNRPAAEVELSSEGGTDRILTIVNQMYESDFDNDEYVAYYIKEINDDMISTKDELLSLYQVLMDNNSEAKHFYDEVFDDDFNYIIVDGY